MSKRDSAIDSSSPFFIGVNVIVLRGDALLLGLRTGKSKHSKQEFDCGSWELPGGHLEFGESMEKAARRELWEETGMSAGTMNFFHIANQPQTNGRHYVQVAFMTTDCVGDPKIREPKRCKEWRWFSLDKLPDSIFFGHKAHVMAMQKNTGAFSDSSQDG